MVHIFKKPMDQVVWFRDLGMSPKDRYIADKLTRLRQNLCYIGQVWNSALLQFGLSGDDVKVIQDQQPTVPGCYLLVTDPELATLGARCSLTPMICVGKCVDFDTNYFHHRQNMAGLFFQHF